MQLVTVVVVVKWKVDEKVSYFFFFFLRVLTHEEKILLDMLPSTHSPLVLYMNRKRKWLWGIGQHWIGDDADKLLLAGRLPSQHFTFTRPANYLFFSRRIWGSPFKFTIEDGVVSEEKELLSKIGHQHDGVRAGEKKSIQYMHPANPVNILSRWLSRISLKELIRVIS